MEGVLTLPCGHCGEDHRDEDCLVAPAPGKVTFALGIPHTPWIAARVASMARLKAALAYQPIWYREFTERESNRVWPSKLWRWGLSIGATHLLQLQDDVVPAPGFWPALRAMVEAQPGRIIGLHSNHPLTVVQHRAGRRWYRDQWLTGPAYVLPRSQLSVFIDWTDANHTLLTSTNEDSLISHWVATTGRHVWHPIPTIADVDQGVPSTYGNDDHHEWSMYRRPMVTWRDVASVAALADPDYWRCTEDAAPLLPGPGTQLCWYCLAREARVTSGASGARICAQCVADVVGQALGRLR